MHLPSDGESASQVYSTETELHASLPTQGGPAHQRALGNAGLRDGHTHGGENRWTPCAATPGGRWETGALKDLHPRLANLQRLVGLWKAVPGAHGP